ncbi:MAG: hypothetical protein QXT63_02530, partial [Thermoplasmata archaeon]
MKIPKGKLAKTLGGGPDTLRNVYREFKRVARDGYLKTILTGTSRVSVGFLFFIKGKPAISTYNSTMQTFGIGAVEKVIIDSLEKDTIVEVYHYTTQQEIDEVRMVFEKTVHARCDPEMNIEKLIDNAVFVKTGETKKGVKENTLEVLAVKDAEMEDEVKAAIDTFKAVFDGKKNETTIGGEKKEKTLKADIETKIKEKEELKKQEQNFKEMEDIISSIIKSKSDALEVEKGVLVEKEKKLEAELAELKKKEDVSKSVPIEIMKEKEKIVGEWAEIKKKEERLAEMEQAL